MFDSLLSEKQPLHTDIEPRFLICVLENSLRNFSERLRQRVLFFALDVLWQVLKFALGSVFPVFQRTPHFVALDLDLLFLLPFVSFLLLSFAS